MKNKITVAEHQKASWLHRLRQKYFPKYFVASILPHHKGFLYVHHNLQQELEPGDYRIYDTQKQATVYMVPTGSEIITSINIPTITKDNIALNISTICSVQVADFQAYLSHYSFRTEYEHMNQDVYGYPGISAKIKSNFANDFQVHIKRFVATQESETIHLETDAFESFETEKVQEMATQYGLKVNYAKIRNVLYPRYLINIVAQKKKAIADAEIARETARNAVATARTLKNAADILSQNENIRFLKVVETIQKVAEHGRHQFSFADFGLK